MTQEEALKEIFLIHGTDCVYIAYTGYNSRLTYQINKENDFKYHIFYMQGSMGMAPCIGLGLALSQNEVPIVVINGDGSYFAQAGFQQLFNYEAISNTKLFQYLIVNNTYESVGNQRVDDNLFDMSQDEGLPGTSWEFDVEPLLSKPDRVGISFKDNYKEIKEYIESVNAS